MKVAAETIEALADDHLLARLHRDRTASRNWCRKRRRTSWRAALASFGPLTAARCRKN
jgi:hypothetical protein